MELNEEGKTKTQTEVRKLNISGSFTLKFIHIIHYLARLVRVLRASCTEEALTIYKCIYTWNWEKSNLTIHLQAT